jgi:AcrR family transcriptional regulator
VLTTVHRSHAGVEETRARILAAARVLFERNGTRGTTTREVAELAGVNEATLFRHFGSKRALLDAMREAACWTEEFRSELASLPGASLTDDLRTIGQFVVETLTAKRAMICISLAEEATGTDDSPEWRGPTGVLDDLVDFFAAKVAAGAMVGEPLLMARCFLGMLFSFVIGRRLWAGGAQDSATLDGIVDIFMHGVKA